MTGGDVITTTTQARFQYLEDVIEALCKAGGLGWEVTKSGANYVFDVIAGVDRSLTVFFDTEFDTSLAQRWLSSDLGRKTAAYVAGQGDGTARTIVTRYANGIEPTGFDRRELFVDARNLSDSAALSTTGDAKLAETMLVDSFEVTVNAFGSFQYRTDWDLGDFVTIRNAAWGLSQKARIIRVTLTLNKTTGNSPDVEVTLDRPFPNLKDAVKNFAVTVDTAD